MALITLVDDDYASGLIAENLRQRGHDVIQMTTLDEALSGIADIASSDLLILDLIMPRSDGSNEGSPESDRSAGMLVYRAVRDLRPGLPILVLTANQDPAPLSVIDDDSHADYISRWGIAFQDLIKTISKLLGNGGEGVVPPQAFIVHGHDDATKLEVKNFLQNTLGLPEPTVLHEQPNVGRTLIEKFEESAASADVVFVLLTPDDGAATPELSDSQKRRARQNVILELGFFMAFFGRRSGRVLLLYKGDLDIPSDLSGVTYLDISGGVGAASDQIRRELAAIGYAIPQSRPR